MLPHLLQHVPVRLLHALDDLFACHSAGKSVRFRQQRTLARDFLDLAGKCVVLQKARDDLLGSHTLGHRESMLHHLALDDGLDDIGNAGLFGELVFAVLKLAPRLEHDHATHKNIGLIYYAFPLQQVGDVAMPSPRGILTTLSSASGPGVSNRCLPMNKASADCDGDHHERREDRISDYLYRMAHALANDGSEAAPIPVRARRVDCAAMVACRPADRYCRCPAVYPNSLSPLQLSA